MKLEKGMRVAVIGGGESGVGAALLAQKMGLEVMVSDAGKLKEAHRKELEDNNIRFEEGGHKDEWLFNVHVAFKSPGVPDHSPLLRSLKESGIPFFSEIEFGYHYYTGSLLAVTGSNGKTTTSGLLGHVLTSAGFDVAVGGNIGTSFCRILAERQPDYMVLEVSSFQLDNVESFRPDIGILLNITPDHLDRYSYDIDQYAAAKVNLARQQRRGDTFIFNGDDPLIAKHLASVSTEADRIAICEADYHPHLLDENQEPMQLSLTGKHNRFNAACVVAAARRLGLDDRSIQQGLQTYKNFPHRLEVVAENQGVSYINDSKATNVDAVYYALEGLPAPIIWIAGGTDKGNDYSAIAPLVADKVKTLICLGVDNSKLLAFAESLDLPTHETQDVREAIRLAHAAADQGDTVLLSPACASFDLFKNYMDRGDQFRAAVLEEIKTIPAKEA